VVSKQLKILSFKQKCHFFSFTKLENRRAEEVLSGGVDTSGRGRKWGKCVGGWI
jgi:hypothetical protein